MSTFFKYTIQWYSEYDDKTIEDCGITYADSYVNAMSNIEVMYGKNAIDSVFIEVLEEELCYILSSADPVVT